MPGYGNEILLNRRICCAEVNKQCQAAHISGSVRLMNHLAPRQTLNSEDKTSETLSYAIPLPKRAENPKWGCFRSEKAQWMQVAGLKCSSSLWIQTQFLFASQIILESINSGSVPDSLCIIGICCLQNVTAFEIFRPISERLWTQTQKLQMRSGLWSPSQEHSHRQNETDKDLMIC